MWFLRRASAALGRAAGQQSDALRRAEAALALQREAIDATREALAVQRETNRLLGDILVRMVAASDPRASGQQ